MNKIPVALLAILLANGSAAAATLAEAQSAYAIFDVTKAESLYRDVAADRQAIPRDRAAAARELARIAWLVDGKADVAADLLDRSLPTDPDPCPAGHLYARIVNDAPAVRGFDAQLTGLASRCLDTEPAIALEAVRSIMLQSAPLADPARRALADKGLRQLASLPEGARASLQGTQLRLALGILAEDASEAFAGWRDYFWLSATEAAPSAFAAPDAEALFRDGLGEKTDRTAALRLARLLMRAGFYDEWRGYAERHRLANAGPDWQPFAAYIRLRETLRREILAHDRKFARAGATEEDAYEARLAEILASAATQAGGSGQDLIATLYRAYGLWGTMPGKSNGVSGVHLGHVVVDDRQKVSQDGRAGVIRFVAIDNMIHNSFSAWLMDGASAPGGWAADATIVQVRPRYLMAIDGFARMAQPGRARTQALRDIEIQRATDRSIAAKTPVAYLPGVRSRLRLDAIDALAADVRRALGPRDSFEIAFRKAYFDASVASSITAHEGRHVLDQASYPEACALTNEELEYRAKLSEIRFAPRPRLAMASIYSPLFGGSSGHGIANRRLLGEYAAWIDANAAKIAGHDPALTALEQLDKLSDGQLVEIAAALDRRANEGC